MKRTVLITGASGGLGAEFARLHAQAGDNLVLVARSAERLEALKAELESRHKVEVLTVALDLGQADAAKGVFEATQDAGLAVDVLINNAGFGGHGRFVERDLAGEQAMIQLNITTLTSMSHWFLPPMLERGKGKILNVASTAAFMPGPLQAVYYATKAYVLSFSQALAEELRDTGVSVTALCPGPIRTGFVERGGLDDVKAFQNAASAESVARCGYEAMEKGQLVVINDKKLAVFLRAVLPFLPRKLVLKLSRQSMEKS